MRALTAISSAFIAVALTLPARAENRAVTNVPTDENAAEANVFMNAKLIAIDRNQNQIQIRDNDGKKRTFALETDATVEARLKPGSDVIVAIKERGRQDRVVSVKSTGTTTTTGAAARPRRQSTLTVLPSPGTVDTTTDTAAVDLGRSVAGDAAAQAAYQSGHAAANEGVATAAVNYAGIPEPVESTQPRPPQHASAGSLGADAAPVPLELAVRSFETAIAQVSTRAAQADRAFGTYQQTCGNLRSTVLTTDPRDPDTRTDWYQMLNNPIRAEVDTGDVCDPLLAAALSLGHEVQQGVRTAEDNARRAGVLPGVMRQIRAAYGMDWVGWDR